MWRMVIYTGFRKLDKVGFVDFLRKCSEFFEVFENCVSFGRLEKMKVEKLHYAKANFSIKI